MRIVVVGAGLGGLAAAIALRSAGHEVQVCERAAEPRESGAGIGLMPNGVLALDALGLGEPVRAMAMPVTGEAGLRDHRGRVLLGGSQEQLEAELGAPAVVVPRRWLHRLLADALPAGTIRTGTDVRSVDPDTATVHADAGWANGPFTRQSRPNGPFTDAGTLTADAVIGADGVGSTLRAQLHPDHPGLVGSDEYAARALVDVPAGLREPGDLPAGELLDRRTGDRFGCMPMAAHSGGNRLYWYATWPASDHPDGAVRGGPASDALRDWLAERRRDWHPAVAELVMATPGDGVHVDETVRLARPLPSYVRGRLALLGDAAHAMTPDLGQGGCQAFEDAVALGRVMAGVDADGVPAALRRYDAARRPRTSAMIAASTRMNRLLTMTGPAALVRNAALRSVPGRLATRAMVRQLRMSQG